MIALTRPDGDEYAKKFNGFLSESEVQELEVGDKFAIMCEKGEHYLAQIKELDEHGVARLHFVGMKKEDFVVCPLWNLYITDEPRHLSRRVQQKQVYHKDYTANRKIQREKAKPTTLSAFHANTRYSDEFLARPYKTSDHRKRRDPDDPITPPPSPKTTRSKVNPAATALVVNFSTRVRAGPIVIAAKRSSSVSSDASNSKTPSTSNVATKETPAPSSTHSAPVKSSEANKKAPRTTSAAAKVNTPAVPSASTRSTRSTGPIVVPKHSAGKKRARSESDSSGDSSDESGSNDDSEGSNNSDSNRKAGKKVSSTNKPNKPISNKQTKTATNLKTNPITSNTKVTKKVEPTAPVQSVSEVRTTRARANSTLSVNSEHSMHATRSKKASIGSGGSSSNKLSGSIESVPTARTTRSSVPLKKRILSNRTKESARTAVYSDSDSGGDSDSNSGSESSEDSSSDSDSEDDDSDSAKAKAMPHNTSKNDKPTQDAVPTINNNSSNKNSNNSSISNNKKRDILSNNLPSIVSQEENADFPPRKRNRTNSDIHYKHNHESGLDNTDKPPCSTTSSKEANTTVFSNSASTSTALSSVVATTTHTTITNTYAPPTTYTPSTSTTTIATTTTSSMPSYIKLQPGETYLSSRLSGCGTVRATFTKRNGQTYLSYIDVPREPNVPNAPAPLTPDTTAINVDNKDSTSSTSINSVVTTVAGNVTNSSDSLLVSDKSVTATTTKPATDIPASVPSVTSVINSTTSNTRNNVTGIADIATGVSVPITMYESSVRAKAVYCPTLNLSGIFYPSIEALKTDYSGAICINRTTFPPAMGRNVPKSGIFLPLHTFIPSVLEVSASGQDMRKKRPFTTDVWLMQLHKDLILLEAKKNMLQNTASNSHVLPHLALLEKGKTFGLTFASSEAFSIWHKTISKDGGLEGLPVVPVEKVLFISLASIYTTSSSYDIKLVRRTGVIIFQQPLPSPSGAITTSTPTIPIATTSTTTPNIPSIITNSNTSTSTSTNIAPALNAIEANPADHSHNSNTSVVEKSIYPHDLTIQNNTNTNDTINGSIAAAAAAAAAPAAAAAAAAAASASSGSSISSSSTSISAQPVHKVVPMIHVSSMEYVPFLSSNDTTGASTEDNANSGRSGIFDMIGVDDDGSGDGRGDKMNAYVNDVATRESGNSASPATHPSIISDTNTQHNVTDTTNTYANSFTTILTELHSLNNLPIAELKRRRIDPQAYSALISAQMKLAKVAQEMLINWEDK